MTVFEDKVIKELIKVKEFLLWFSNNEHNCMRTQVRSLALLSELRI